jgi:hypothetical protein
VSLQTPWLRDELRSHLLHLSDAQWLQRAVDPSGLGHALDEVLDFLDDTGVADDPAGRIGYILYDQCEADAMTRLGQALDLALDGRADERWQSVSEAARHALGILE